MKKIVLIALVLVITTAFVFTAFQAPGGGTDTFAGRKNICPQVGWNTRACISAIPAKMMVFHDKPIFTPNVGWNS